MVTILNTDCNTEKAGAVHAFILLSAWITSLLASTFTFYVTRLARWWHNIVRVVLFGGLFLVASATFGESYAQNPVLTIEANPYSYADDGGNNYIIVSDRDLTQELTVNYQVISGGTPTAVSATFPVMRSYTINNVNVNINIREIRVLVTDSSHTEVKLVAGNNYELGTPSSATKIDAHEIASGSRGVQMKFLEDTVTEGTGTTGNKTIVVLRWTPNSGTDTYNFNYKIGADGTYQSGHDFSDDGYLLYPNPELNMSGRGGVEFANEFYFIELTTVPRDSSTDSPVLFMAMDSASFWTSHNDLHEDSIIIMDDDGDPQISIETSTEKVLKGMSFPITISGPSSLSSSLSIALSEDDFSSGHFASYSENTPISLSATTKSKTIMVNTNPSASGDGIIEISLTDGSNYDLNPGKSSVQVKIIDNDMSRPQITVNNNNTNEIAEGTNMATFNIVSNVQAPKGGIEVRYSLNQVQNFFTLPDTRTATILENQTSVRIQFTGRAADANFSGDGLLTMTLLDDTTPATYQVNETNDAHIARVSVADSMRTAGKVYMKLLGSSTVTEGQRAEVQIGLGSILTTAKKIYVNVDQLSTGNYLASDPPAYVEIPAGSLSAVYTLATQDDSTYDPTVSAVFSLTENIPEVDYQISTTDKSLTIEVTDNDAPPDNLSIIPLQPTVVEGVPSILFQLTTSVEHTFEFDVNVTVAKNSGGDFLNLSPPQGNVCSGATTSLNCTVRFTARSKFKHFAVLLKPDNNIDQSDGIITATITSVSQSAVMINDSAKSTQVTIVDSDAPPVMKLAITSSNVTDDTIFETNVGQDIEFTYSVKTDSSAGITTEESTSDITIHYSVVENVGDFLADGQAGDDKTAVLDAGDDDGNTFVVSVEGDTEDEIDGNFTVTLKPDVDTNTPKTYTVSQVDSERTIRINVTDDEVPIVTITTDQSTISESEDIIVNLATDIAPHQDLTFELCVSDGSNTSTGCSNPASSSPSGDFLKTPLTQIMVTLPVGANSVSPGQNYTIELDDDSAVEGDGSVIVYFAYTAFTENATGYGLPYTSDATKSQISVVVEDNDPTISITADDSDNSIVEGADAVFTITSNAQITTQRLLVQVDISQEGDYWDLNNNMTIGSNPLAISHDPQTEIGSIVVPIEMGESSASFTIGTDDDAGDGAREDSGSISAEIIVPDQNPEYSKGSNFKAVLNVVDNDDPTPEISIQSVQTDAVEEGETIIFELTANKAIPDNGLEILICIRDGTKKSDNTGCTIDTMGVGEYLGVPVPKQITMPANAPERTVRIEVPTVDDNVIDVAGTIYAEVLTNSDDDSYRPLAVKNSATVQITDNDPSLSISPKDGKGVIAENEGPAEFVITSNVAPTSQLSVRVIMSEVGGNYLKSADEVTRELSIDFPAGQTEVDFTFDIDDDTSEEVFGGVRAELDSREQFTVGYFVVNERDPNRSSSAVVIVNDDDGGSVPTISIAGVNDAVNEGEDAVFEVSTTPSLPLGSTLPVQIMVEEGAPSYIADSADLKIHTVMIKSGVSGSIGELAIKTRSNSEDEVHGSIKATIQSDSENYRVASVNFATVAILDDDGADIPAVSIITTTPNITEGNTANFMVKSARSRDTDLIVNINIADPNNFIIWRIPNFITIPSGEKEAGFTIATGTQSDEPGSITVTIVNTDWYDIVLPMMQVVEVQAQTTTVDPARISVADVAVNTILDFLNVNSGSSPTTTENSFSDPTTNLPEISIIATSELVEEGQPARFVVTSRHGVGKTLRISVNISGTTGTIASDSTRTLVIGTQQHEIGFEIPTIDDERAEKDGYVTATLSQSPNFSIIGDADAVVTISDATDRERRRNQLETANSEVLTNLHNALGVANWSNISNQIEFALAGKSKPSLVLGGQSTVNHILTSNVQAFDNEAWSLKSLLGNSSFSFDLTPSEQATSLGTVWGLGNQQSLSQDYDGTSPWTADLFTTQFGSDIRINDDSLFGLSVAISDSNVEFGRDDSTSIQYGVQNNNLQSYFGWQAPDQNSQIHVSTGVGFGEIELNQDDYNPMHLQSTNYALAVKGNTLLYSSPNLANQMSTQVEINGDSYLSQLHITETTGFLDDLTAYASWSRLGFEVTNQYDFNSHQSIQVNTSFSGLSQREEDDLNMGLITQSGFTYTDQYGISFSGEGQLLMHHEQQLGENYGIKGEISFDQGRDSKGVLFNMIPIWNFAETSAENQLMSKRIVNQNIIELFQSEQNIKLTSELGYGLGIFDNTSRLTPFGGFGYSVNAENKFHLGTRLQLGPDLKFELQGRQETDNEGTLNQAIKLDGVINW